MFCQADQYFDNIAGKDLDSSRIDKGSAMAQVIALTDRAKHYRQSCGLGLVLRQWDVKECTRSGHIDWVHFPMGQSDHTMRLGSQFTTVTPIRRGRAHANIGRFTAAAMLFVATACVSGQAKDSAFGPAASVAIFPGQDIAAEVNANPPGTRFLIKAGVHRGQRIRPKDGDEFVGEPGAVFDGEDTVQFAFDGITGGRPFPRNVTIQGLVVRGYHGPLQSGAILAGNMWQLGEETEGWVVEDNEITANTASGVRIGSHMRVLRNRIHHNGQIGVNGAGNETLIAFNEIAYNNVNNVDPGWEAGGAKFVLVTDLIVRGNYVHHNNGHGLWTDISSYNVLYENNRCEDNALAGIFHEVSYTATIRHNVVQRNGFGQPEPAWVLGAGIQIANSSHVEVYDNVVIDNRQGITAYHQARGSTGYDATSPKPHGPWTTNDVFVHDNTIDMRVGRTGMAQDVDTSLDLFVSRNNRFTNNSYRIANADANPFEWRNAQLSAVQWRGFGQDSGGSFVVIP